MRGFTMRVGGRRNEKKKADWKYSVSLSLYLICPDLTLSNSMDDSQFFKRQLSGICGCG